MFNKKLLAASMAAAISTGIATQASAVSMQENNLGEILLAPLYLASGGMNTEITVVNTRTDVAVKAKIVFREATNSSEVLDFILYLSPGDVWRGTVAGEIGAAVMESTDDSMTGNDGNFASEASPVSQPFFDKESSGSNGFGHFEVFGAYTITTGNTGVTAVSNPANNVVVAQGMDKRDLKKLFDTITPPNSPVATPNFGAITGGAAPQAVASSDSFWLKQLMGEVQLVVGDNALTNYEIPAMGFDGFTGPVIASNAYDVLVGLDSLIGIGMGVGGLDALDLIEAAIASSDTAFEYNVDGANVTAPVVSFVTKYRHRGSLNTHGPATTSACAVSTATIPLGEVGHYSGPFNDTVQGAMTYSLTSFDNSENSATVVEGQFSGGTVVTQTMPNEVNLLLPSYFSTSGWADITWRNSRTCSAYYGVPALSATVKTRGATMLWTENGDRRTMYYMP